VKIVTILFLFPIILLAQITPEQSEAVDKVFEECDRTDHPGCALAIIIDGKIAYEKGYGMADLERGLSISPTTVFYAGSISKQFVAACALLLHERGKIDLADPIQKYLPAFPAYEKPITIQHLIYHTSGIKDYFKLFEVEGIDYLNQIARDRVYELIANQDSLDFIPGEKYAYSNSGYLLLGMIVEEASGMTFSEFVKREIFQPLDMRHSLFLDDNRKLVPNRAWGYHLNLDGEPENMLMRFDLIGSGGLYTTVEDLYKWDQNLYTSEIGTVDFLPMMMSTGKLNDGTDTKYSFAIRHDMLAGKKVIGHSGALGGYRAQFMQFPDQETSIIILGNFANFKPGESAHQIAKILFK